MKNILARLEEINRKYGNSKNAERIITELKYITKVSLLNNNMYADSLTQAVRKLETEAKKYETITKQTVQTIEDTLCHLSSEIKEVEVLCVGHSHIDMNWMWGWHETVQLTIDTFQTVLDLMDEYPELTFSQSQASCFQIVEEHDSEMLEDIKKRVNEGRWEISTSSWVEGDRNMANTESSFRHCLYTQQYLSKLFNLDKDYFNFDFQPDTFGHNANVPEILSKCGIKYYYFCRGFDKADKHPIFRWRSPSGSELLTHCEPVWYDGHIENNLFDNIPTFCKKNNLKKYLTVYGIGNHGGGLTRCDINKIKEMQDWPLVPKLKFSTYQEYFSYLETKREQFPIIEQELNYIFTGCYTSESRIKLANRLGEAAMYNTEFFCTLAKNLSPIKYHNSKMEKAWQNILFNHFHDILPGTGITETREYTMGLFQETMAIANTNRKKALMAIAENIDTSGLFIKEDEKPGMAEGAGAGYDATNWRISKTERCDGKNRIYHVFNSLPYSRNSLVNLTIWDWKYDLKRLICKDINGDIIKHQIIKVTKDYWWHSCFDMLINIEIPAGGYTTIVISENDEIESLAEKDFNPRIQTSEELILENKYLRAEFNDFGELISLINKNTHEELICKESPASFRLADEEGKGGSAWHINKFQTVKNINTNVMILGKNLSKDSILQFIDFEVKVRDSKLKYTVCLAKNSTALSFKCNIDWCELGSPKKGVPNLHYHIPLKKELLQFHNDIPGGIIKREPMNNDVPGLSFISGSGIQIVTDSKYGYKGWKDSLTTTLIHSSFDPDPYPEICNHKINFALFPVSNTNKKQLLQNARSFCSEPEVISAYKKNKGNLPLSNELFSIEGNAELSCVKIAENSNDMIIRLYSLSDKITEINLKLPGKIKSAIEVDGNEQEKNFGSEIKLNKNKLEIKLQPLMTHTFKLKL